MFYLSFSGRVPSALTISILREFLKNVAVSQHFLLQRTAEQWPPYSAIEAGFLWLSWLPHIALSLRREKNKSPHVLRQSISCSLLWYFFSTVSLVCAQLFLFPIKFVSVKKQNLYTGLYSSSSKNSNSQAALILQLLLSYNNCLGKGFITLLLNTPPWDSSFSAPFSKLASHSALSKWDIIISIGTRRLEVNEY